MRVGMYFCHSGLVFHLHQLLCGSFLLSPSVAALVFFSSPSVATPVLSFLSNSCHSSLGVFHLHHLPQWSCFSSPSIATVVLFFISITCHSGLVFHLHHLPQWSCFSFPSVATVVLFFISITCHSGLVFHLYHLPHWSCVSSLSLAAVVLSCYQCSHGSHFSGEQATPTAAITIDTCKMKVADYMSKYRITEN